MTFRHWIQEMWMQHKDEYMELNMSIPESSAQEYFRKYKYWLKREYKHQKILENVGESTR
jgi:predicted solute-binding protein